MTLVDSMTDSMIAGTHCWTAPAGTAEGTPAPIAEVAGLLEPAVVGNSSRHRDAVDWLGVSRRHVLGEDAG